MLMILCFSICGMNDIDNLGRERELKLVPASMMLSPWDTEQRCDQHTHTDTHSHAHAHAHPRTLTK